MGQDYSAVLTNQLRLLQVLEEKRHIHRVEFDSLFREAVKYLEWTDSLISHTSSDPAIIQR